MFNQEGGRLRLEQTLDSTLDSVDTAESQVLELATQAGFNEDHLHKLGMAVREAMVNAVVHGNRYNLKKKVHLEADAQEEEITVVIADEGEGFNASDLPDPLAEENLLRQSGRGLLLIRAFVDEFEMHKAEPPLGMRVKLVVKKSEESD